MLGTSAIQDILWLVPRSEGACPAVNGVDMYQLVSAFDAGILDQEKSRKRAYLIKETNARNTTGIRFAYMTTYFIHLIMRPFDYTDVLVVWGIQDGIIYHINYSKYFPVSDWLKPHR